MTAEAIARVVADVRGLRAKMVTVGDPDRDPSALQQNRRLADYCAMVAVLGGPVVDCTAVYRGLVAKTREVRLYEDHPCIAPPWKEATYAYVNEHGNVVVMTSFAAESEDEYGNKLGVGVDGRRWSSIPEDFEASRRWTQPEGWETPNPLEWDRVRWMMETVVWCGGRGANGPVPTVGPLHLWRFAIYEDGSPADLHWVRVLDGYPMEHWDMAHLTLLGALSFLNASNVKAVEPRRSRAAARRIARHGVHVHEIQVFPVGRSSRGRGAQSGGGMPLTAVRGSFHHYGNCCPGVHEPKGLLFGKLEGKFYVPAHVRGSEELGEDHHDYRLRAEG